MENVAYDEKYASEYYPKYILVTVQYIRRINAEKILKFMKEYQNTNDPENKAGK